MHPLAGASQRSLGLAAVVLGVEGLGRVVRDLRQLQRQHRLGQRVRRPLLVEDDREGLAPIALAREEPVAQLVVDRALAPTAGVEPLDHHRLRVGEPEPIEVDLGVLTVDRRTVAGPGGVHVVVGGRLDGAHDRQLVGLGEVPVTLVLRRHRHDRAGAITHEDVVGDEDRDPRPVGRVDGIAAGEDTGLLLGVGLPLQVRFARGCPPVCRDRGFRGLRTCRPQRVGPFGPVTMRHKGFHEGMLGGEHHEGRPEEGVGAGREDLDRGIGVGIARPGLGDREAHERAMAAPDPVALHELDLFGPLDPVEVIGQPVGIRGDAHHPLAQVLLEDREVAALGASLVGDLFVGQDRAQTWRPVDRGLGGVGQPVGVEDLRVLVVGEIFPAQDPGQRSLPRGELLDEFTDRPSTPTTPVGADGLGVIPGVEDLQEDPLRPAVVVGVDRPDRTPVIVTHAQALELARHDDDVVLGRLAGVLTGLDGILLGRQAEGVVAQAVEDVLAEHSVVAAEDVGGDVAERVTDVQALAARVGEHVEHEQAAVGVGLDRGLVGPGTCGVRGAESPLRLPAVLPGDLDLVSQGCGVAVRGLAHLVLVIRAVGARLSARKRFREDIGPRHSPGPASVPDARTQPHPRTCQWLRLGCRDGSG